MSEIISFNARVNHITRLIELSESESKDCSVIIKKSKYLSGIISLFNTIRHVKRDFHLSVFEAFAIDGDNYVTFEMTNNQHAPITIDQLPRLIAQHKTSASFYVELFLDQSILSLKAEVMRLISFC